MAAANIQRFLFLQGMPNWFFSRLGDQLRQAGHEVHRINLNAGDWLFWAGPNAINFRGTPGQWPDFLRETMVRHGITDLILFGDCRPSHLAAIPVATACGVLTHVCEEGYLRPHWVTFEAGGVNANSPLPREPAYYHAAAQVLPQSPSVEQLPSSFLRRIVEDMSYNIVRMACAPLYPHAQSHRPRNRLVEYASWSRKLLRRPWTVPRSRRAQRRIGPGTRYFLFPLQLDSDSQIRTHSPLGGMAPTIRYVIDCFARSATPDDVLVVKEHPMDEMLSDWAALVGSVAAARGVSNRVVYLHVGDMQDLLRDAAGVVTVNSSAGMQALALGKPVIALGPAIYKIAGLTHQADLDVFWADPAPPDAALRDAFIHVLKAKSLLAGGFYSDAGLKLLVNAAVQRLTGVRGTAPPS